MKRRGLPKYVSEFQDRHGKWRTRARRRGMPTHYFSAQPGTEEFENEYRAWRDGAPLDIAISRTQPGTINDLVVRYYRSVGWANLAASTKTQRRNILERFREKAGNKAVATLRREDITRMIEAKLPAAGRHFRNALRALMVVALDAGYIRQDPTAGVKIKRAKGDGYHTWTEDEIATFEAAHPIVSRPRLAFALLLYTGQRRSDVVLMGRQHIRDGRIFVKQVKTKTELLVAIHPRLQEVLDAHGLDNLTFLVTEFGKPFAVAGFGNWFRKQIRTAKLPEHCSAHGLRKAAARRLAEAGCTAPQIAAVTGHKSLREVERYIKDAAQIGLADAAIATVSRTETEHKLSNLDGRLDKFGSK
ncbi:MAG: tyrosine-type recombinase/integrase [Rhodospirillaceae bacterium]|jgi:integrase|nr:tyrosine-type recombinase/integrase [Rhodospirillaceae bacterium]MBT3492828.1 tyrosine-type recombinase/integrase [Rhodospirillaceae bacterium]MBT3779993.1 tyrosine-type recombinase/integrase [Rhodospirillaceae bacterium]MBT3976679.1 tyrosine-type recombinase/integrase [Rhodospirillaceae bacterium]MBT4168431.1 tyrosine-type recombinase/integrase [Rhodospirillaceae bacterium]